MLCVILWAVVGVVGWLLTILIAVGAAEFVDWLQERGKKQKRDKKGRFAK
jgi:hypothetical protein